MTVGVSLRRACRLPMGSRASSTAPPAPDVCELAHARMRCGISCCAAGDRRAALHPDHSTLDVRRRTGHGRSMPVRGPDTTFAAASWQPQLATTSPLKDPTRGGRCARAIRRAPPASCSRSWRRVTGATRTPRAHRVALASMTPQRAANRTNESVPIGYRPHPPGIAAGARGGCFPYHQPPYVTLGHYQAPLSHSQSAGPVTTSD